MPPSQQKIKQAPSFAAQKYSWIERITRDARVSHLQVRVALLISFHLNSVSGDAWPSQGAFAEALDVTPRAVQIALKGLAQLGYLRIGIHKGRGYTNRYRPVFEDMDAQKEEPPFVLTRPKIRIPVQKNTNSHS